MKNLVTYILRIFAKLYLIKNNPEIIGITGSVGKTTTKKAVSLLVSGKYKTNNSYESGYNTEIGIPLFILNQKVPDKNYLWPIVIIKSFFSIFDKKRIEKLVIEMGTDKPGEIAHLLFLIKPKISIVTSIGYAHIEQFKTLENTLKEKGQIVEQLPEKGTAILNFDDNLVMKLKDKTKAKIMTFGFSKQADVYVESVQTSISGTRVKIKTNKGIVNLFLNTIGDHMVYSILASICCGLIYNYSIKEIEEFLSGFKSVKGRMNLIKGIKESYIIDDSYNASPASVIEALKTLSKIAPKRRVAVLGTMNEMGEEFESAHKYIGGKAKELIDVLIGVGHGGEIIIQEAEKQGLDKKNIYWFNGSKETGEKLKDVIHKNDTLLFKGSQNNVRLERAIVKIMENPDDAENILVRQGKFWDKKP